MKHPRREIWDWPTNSLKVEGRFTRSIKLATFFGLSVKPFFIIFGNISLVSLACFISQLATNQKVAKKLFLCKREGEFHQTGCVHDMAKLLQRLKYFTWKKDSYDEYSSRWTKLEELEQTPILYDLRRICEPTGKRVSTDTCRRLPFSCRNSKLEAFSSFRSLQLGIAWYSIGLWVNCWIRKARRWEERTAAPRSWTFLI